MLLLVLLLGRLVNRRGRRLNWRKVENIFFGIVVHVVEVRVGRRDLSVFRVAKRCCQVIHRVT